MNKKGFEFSFGWMFAIIAGATILILAIYGVSKFIIGEERISEGKTAQEIDILLKPLQTEREEASVGVIHLPQRMALRTGCTNEGNFGEQKINVETLKENSEEKGLNNTNYSTYIFSEQRIEGNEIISFSKSFSFPYPVASLTFLWSEDDRYCFVNPSSEIKEEFESLFIEGNLTKSIIIVDEQKKCPSKSISVCFANTGCSVDVSLESKSVTKKRNVVYYEDSLIYGAIFSDPKTYECQVQRLFKRVSQLALIYNGKSNEISLRANGCSSALQPLLVSFANLTASVNSGALREMTFLSKELERGNNEIGNCKLF